MSTLYLYDDERARGFEPFALTRPVSELRAGAEVIRRRWTRAAALEARGFVAAPHLAEFEELDAPTAVVGALPAGCVLANARCVVALDERLEPDAQAWTCEGRVAAVRLAREVSLAALRDGAATLETLASDGSSATVRGRWLDEPWDPIAQLAHQLAEDLALLGPTLDAVPHAGAVVGDGAVWVERGATVDPFVVFDTQLGPVVVRRGTSVRAFTRLVGPCYVGEDSIVSGDTISGCSIGEVSRVHGDITASVVLGHTNKAHDGFVGHSYIGRWVNLGAGTMTSNLKNTYGTVTMWTPAGVRDTGLQFLGSLLGDHVKTGIGLRLTTGCVIGAGANVYDCLTPKAVPPFAWGARPPYATYDVERFLDVAERAMSRRHVPLTERMRRQLRAAHAARWLA